MKTLIPIIFLFVTTLSIGQIEYSKQAQLLLDAKRAKKQNLKSKALNLYQKAFQIHPSSRGADYTDAALLAAELNQPSLSEQLLKEGTVKKKNGKDFILNFSKNKVYLTIAKKVVQNYNQYLTEFYRELKDPVAYYKIQKILSRDQETRKINDYFFGITEEMQDSAMDSLFKYNKAEDKEKRKKFQDILWPKMSKEHDEFYKKSFVFADSLNVRELMSITKEHGWQKEGWMILWHQRGNYGQDNWIWDFFKPYINKEIKKGTVPPFFWAQLEDFASYLNTGTTIYGYWPGKVNPETVNKNRKSIGLPELTAEEITLRNTTRGGSVF